MLREGKLFNGTYYLANISLLRLSKEKFFGLNKSFFSLVELRCEVLKEFNFNKYSITHWISFFNFFYTIIPKGKIIKKKNLLNIFFLDVISSYRGWRHARGLPVRGQRTWTNAWSSYKSNLVLRHYKIILLRRVYNKVSLSDLNIAYAAEQFNLLWKVQWENEWLDAKKKRLQLVKKRQGLVKIDLISMARGQINIPKSSKNSSKKKNKGAKNAFNLGFDPGFTKILLKTPLAAQVAKKQNKVVKKPKPKPKTKSKAKAKK